jgi:hypothetical protein
MSTHRNPHLRLYSTLYPASRATVANNCKKAGWPSISSQRSIFTSAFITTSLFAEVGPKPCVCSTRAIMKKT